VVENSIAVHMIESPAIQLEASLKEIRREISIDWGFLVLVLLSLLIHGGVSLYFRTIPLPMTSSEPTLEIIPERLAKIIMDKPALKEGIKKTEGLREIPLSRKEIQQIEESRAEGDKRSIQDIARAKQSVQSRATHVAEKIRSRGVLALLVSSQGISKSKRTAVDLFRDQDMVGVSDIDEVLRKSQGIRQSVSEEDLTIQLVESKKIVEHSTKGIGDLLASMNAAQMNTLRKIGDIKITRPSSLEGAAASSANRDYNTINQVAKQFLPSIKGLYNKYLKNDPSLQGKVTVRFEIKADGTIGEINIIYSDIPIPEFQDDLLRRIKRWQFPPIKEDEGSLFVTYPIIFEPAIG